MKITKLGEVEGGRQDGAIWNRYFFEFKANGLCRVYDVTNLEKGDVQRLCAFQLDKSDVILPHSNAVVFGTEYYEEGDEFPLLYSNMYNNCANAEDRREGMCLVYRLQREGAEFKSTLVQAIQIGFVKDTALWMTKDDVRPYGNFVIDRDKNILYAFTMRDATQTTRYFSFNLPKLADGEMDGFLGVRKVILQKEDILTQFDCPYHQFIQGACCHKGLIYSTEGFANDAVRIPAIRVIDPVKQEQLLYLNLMEMGYKDEPEMIDFVGDVCYYGDGNGELFRLDF